MGMCVGRLDQLEDLVSQRGRRKEGVCEQREQQIPKALPSEGTSRNREHGGSHMGA